MMRLRVALEIYPDRVAADVHIIEEWTVGLGRGLYSPGASPAHRFYCHLFFSL